LPPWGGAAGAPSVVAANRVRAAVQRAIPIGRVPSVITWLELLEPPRRPPVQPSVPGTEIVRALEPTVHFYRYLYDTVGAPWLWNRRRLLDDATLARQIRAPTTDLRVLWVHGVPAGYVELDFADLPDVAIAYFGLVPEFTGRGLGPYLLDWTIRHGFAKGAGRLHLNTCDLDHPKALRTYEAAGFQAYDRTESFETLLDDMTLPAHAQGKPILPLA
jgi:GNAT superfamily N-acetyltransferase